MLKKRLLICIDWYYPAYKAGGPVQSVYNLVQALKDRYQIYVLAGDRDLGDQVAFQDEQFDQWKSMDGYQVMYLSRNQISYFRIRQILRETTPDHLYINGMFSWYFSICPLLVNWRHEYLKKTLITIAPRGMLLQSATSKKAFKKRVFFTFAKPLFKRSNIRFQATNIEEKESVNLKFPLQTCFIANNLGKQEQRPNRPLLKDPGSIELVFIARIDPIKNLDALLELLAKTNGQVTLTIVGPIDDTSYWERCLTIIGRLPANIQVKYLGALHPAEVASALERGHLYVLLTKGENFGHSIFESWLAGRPVLISDQTPWKNLQELRIGFDISLKRQDLLLAAIHRAIAWSQTEFDEYSKDSWNFAARYLLEDKNKAKYFEIFE